MPVQGPELNMELKSENSLSLLNKNRKRQRLLATTQEVAGASQGARAHPSARGAGAAASRWLE